MKITEKLYKRMQRCCNWQNKISEEVKRIEIELERLGIDCEKMRYHDSSLVDFMDYGRYITQEQVEEALSDEKIQDVKRRKEE